MMDKAYEHRQVTYRLLPGDKAGHNYLFRLLCEQQQLYNAALEANQDQYRKTGKGTTFYDDCKSLTELRRSLEGFADTPLALQRGTIKRKEESLKGFFRRAKAGAGHRSGYPRFKAWPGAKCPHARKFTSLEYLYGIRIKGDRLVLPATKRTFELRRSGGNPYPDGVPVKAVLRLDARGRWDAIVCMKIDTPIRPDDGRELGVDMNVGQVADSDGEIHYMPDLARLDARRKRHQRRADRCQKGSNRQRKRRAKADKALRKIARISHTWRHHVSKKMAAKAGTIKVEKLNTPGMTKSAKGTEEEPGKNVKAKSGLNRAILRTGWGEIKQMLEYKAAQVKEVNPAYTSQTCNACGVIDPKSRRSQSEFVCTACGHKANADVNAALNIKAAVDAASARRVRPRPSGKGGVLTREKARLPSSPSDGEGGELFMLVPSPATRKAPMRALSKSGSKKAMKVRPAKQRSQ